MQKTTALVLFVILVLGGIMLFLYKQGWLNYGRAGKPLVYFVTNTGDHLALTGAPRDTTGGSTADQLKAAITSLIAGPTDEETAQGLLTSVPANAKLNNAWIEDGIAFLDFSREIEKGGGTAEMRERLAQIVYTATQFTEVTAVRLLIDNKPIKYFSSEGLTDVENPLSRTSFQDILSEKETRP